MGLGMGNIKGITLEINGNASSLTKELSGVNRNIKDLDARLKNVKSALEFNPGNMELLAKKSELTAKKILETKKALDTLREADAQVKAQFDKGEIGEVRYEAFRIELKRTEAALQKLEESA